MKGCKQKNVSLVPLRQLMSGIFNEWHVKNIGFHSRESITVFLVAYKFDLHILKEYILYKNIPLWQEGHQYRAPIQINIF